MSNSSCNSTFYHAPLIIVSSFNVLAGFACLIAAIFVCVLKLHKKPVYRLILYQILAGLCRAAVFIGQQYLVNYGSISADHGKTFRGFCEAFGFLFTYTEWMHLMFTTWVTVYLFSFAVFFVNVKRFEAMFVIMSLLLPAVVAVVPLLTGTYGPAGLWCWIKGRNCDANTPDSTGVIEQFALWYGPCMVVLVS